MVTLLSVLVTNNTEKTFSMFSRDPSMSLNMSKWACFHPPFSIHCYAAFSAMEKLAWAFVSNGRAVCSTSTKQAFYSLEPPGKSYVPQEGLRLIRVGILDFIIFQKSSLCSPFRHTIRDNIAHVQSQRTWQIWTCTPRLQLPSKLCLITLELTEEFLRTFSCPLLSLHLKWPLCIRHWCVVLIYIAFANFHKCLAKGAINVKQIARECSGPPLGSYVLNACIGRVAYVSTLMSLQQDGQIRPH